MRQSLSGVRSRVERLSSALGVGGGCATCRELPITFVHVLDDVEDARGEKVCPSCGRARRVLRIIHELPAEPVRLEWLGAV